MHITAYSCRPDEVAFFNKFGKQLGAQLTLTEAPPTVQTAPLAAGCKSVSIITTPTDAATLDALWEQGVRSISTRTIGYDHIDMAHAKELGMHVSNVSYSTNSVADYTIMLMLMVTRRFKSIQRHTDVQNYTLNGMRGRELPNLTVGVVGTGRIGRTVISRLTGFGCRVLASDLYRSADVEPFADYVDLDTLLHKSDLITLHMPATKDNYHMIDAQAIAAMKPGAMLVNTARGALIDTQALMDGIESGKLGGAALDVVENEGNLYYNDMQDVPLQNRAMAVLRTYPNVILTPHAAFYTDQAVSDMVEHSVQSCVAFCKGEEDPWRVL